MLVVVTEETDLQRYQLFKVLGQQTGDCKALFRVSLYLPLLPAVRTMSPSAG